VIPIIQGIQMGMKKGRKAGGPDAEKGSSAWIPDEDRVLEIDDLRVRFKQENGWANVVDGVSFSLRRGSILGLVGESGCGKSVTSMSILRLIRPPGEICGGSIRLRNASGRMMDVLQLPEKSKDLYALRGGVASMIFQEPMTALSPVHTIANQIMEAIRLHRDVGRAEAEAIAVDMLNRVGIPNPADRLKRYPFEFSGGMRQRVMIAMALVCNPALLIADEPTTALDVTIQAQILQMLCRIRDEIGTSVLLITHDLGVVAQTADEVAVMYLGRIVERGTVRDVIKTPRHPYTMGLIASLPGMSTHHRRLPSIKGSIPSAGKRPAGCCFHPRCPYYQAGRCDMSAQPALEFGNDGRAVACFRWREIMAEEKES